jgi:ATP-binding cassette subfamily B protein
MWRISAHLRRRFEAGETDLSRRRSLLRLLGEGPRPLVALFVAVTVLTGLLPVGFTIGGGVLAQRIEEAVAAGAPGSATDRAYQAFAVVIALFLASEMLMPLQGQLRWRVMKQLDEIVRERTMAAAVAGADMSRLHDPDFLAALRRFRAVVHYSATPGGAAVGLVDLGRHYLAGLSAAAVVAWFSPLIAALVLAVALFERFQWRRAILRIIDVWIEGMPSFSEARYFVELGLGSASAKEIRLFGLRRWLGPRIHAAGVAGWTPTWEARSRGMGRQNIGQIVLVGGSATIALVWAARAAAAGDLSTGGLVMFVSAMFAVVYGLGVLTAGDTAVEYGARVVPAVETIERSAADAVASETGRRAPASDAPPAIELRDVWFRYPGSEEDVLRGVTLEIPAGGSISLVGTNGAGKTTLIRLACGLYRPQRGRILVDGIDLDELDVEAWHRRIAPMFQEFLRLQGTVAENIGVGAVHRIDDADGIREAAAEAGVLGFAERLPEGLDTEISGGQADGQGLSGGQWQRIGIARALFGLRAGAGFLILDEPTSNLDTGSEERLIRRLVDGTRGVATTALVTHRLALARRTDRIYVVEGGAVAEAGTHDELLAAGGRYADAFGMQAALYPLEEPDDG